MFPDKGERQVPSLPHEHRAVTLINGRPANSFASQVGMAVLDVGSWIVLVAEHRLMPMPMGVARFGLEHLEGTHRSSPASTHTAKKALEELARGGWR